MNFITYLGPSMNPTFRSGELLQVLPYQGERIRPGDVIVFIPPNGERKIVHRVVSSGPGGIRTRGDNNERLDPDLLQPENLVGRVIGARKGRRGRRVRRGFAGRLFSAALRAIRKIDGAVSFLLRPVYHRIGRKPLCRRAARRLLTTRTFVFHHPQGIELQLLAGRRMIAWLPPGGSRWRLRRPYRLFVEETSLVGLPERIRAFPGGRETPSQGP